MTNFVNPLDLIIIITLLLIGAIGVYNGFIVECKKTISLFIAVLLSKLIFQYVPFIKNIFNPLITYVILIIILIYTLRVILNLIIYYAPVIEIDKEVNNFMGGILGILKGLIVTSIVLFILELSPIQDSSKNKIFNKANQVSILFKTCNNIKNFLLK
tara:strand:- start:4016 stop:4486 length:471 start_codon:yes stop_codon:yes gene_type:complete